MRKLKIGIDIGRVIIGGDEATRQKIKDEDTDFITATGHKEIEAIKKTPEVEDATESIALLMDMFQGEVWLVSKCKENTQRKTRKWLKHNKFFEQTGVNPSRLLFCYNRWDKPVIASGLGLTHFIDDKLGCIGTMEDVPYRYWFGHSKGELIQLPEGIYPAPNWSSVMSQIADFFRKIR